MIHYVRNKLHQEADHLLQIMITIANNLPVVISQRKTCFSCLAVFTNKCKVYLHMNVLKLLEKQLIKADEYIRYTTAKKI